VGAAGRARLLVPRVLVEQQRQHVARGRLGQVLHEQDVVRRRLAARARAGLRRPAAGLQAARAPGAGRPPRLLRGWGGTWNDEKESHGAVEHKGVQQGRIGCSPPFCHRARLLSPFALLHSAPGRSGPRLPPALSQVPRRRAPTLAGDAHLRSRARRWSRPLGLAPVHQLLCARAGAPLKLSRS